MPDVRISRRDERTFDVTVCEDAARPPGVSLSFLGTASQRLPAGEVLRELAKVVDAVRERMRSVDDWTFNNLTEGWDRVRSPAVLAAGRLGLCLDDFQTLSQGELEALDAIRNDNRSLAIAEASPRESLAEKWADAQALLAEVPSATRLPQETSAWIDARFDARSGAPWAVGWGVAELVRQRAHLAATTPLGVNFRAWLAQYFDWPQERQVVDMSHRVEGVDMVTVRPRGKMPTSLISRRGDTSVRFRVAKSLYYALSSEDEFVVDSVRFLRNSEANAFAAELLAPRAFIEDRIPPGGWWSSEDVENVARECAVFPRVIEHQIDNRELGRYER